MGWLHRQCAMGRVAFCVCGAREKALMCTWFSTPHRLLRTNAERQHEDAHQRRGVLVAALTTPVLLEVECCRCLRWAGRRHWGLAASLTPRD